MKRLLIAPLLIALAGCSNQLGITNNVGEKIVVKDSTVEKENYYHSDILSSHEYLIAEAEKDLKAKQRRVDEYSDPSSFMNKTSDSGSSEGDLIAKKEEFCKEKNSEWHKSYCEQYKLLLKSHRETKKDWEKKTTEAIQKVTDLKRIKDELISNKSSLIYAIDVSYTPISIDLNKKQTVMPSEALFCLNPKFMEFFLEVEKAYPEAERSNNSLSPFDKAICKKYAKF